MSYEPPSIPSEILEPQLEKFLGCMVGMIGAYRRCPPKAKWLEWHNMMRGVDYLVMGNRPKDNRDPTGIHASLAYNHGRCKLTPICGYKQDKFDRERAREIWQNCRAVVTEKT